MSSKVWSRLSIKLARRRTNERGAYAVLFSMMLVLVIALAAIAVDIASQVDSKQRLKDTMDAAAHEAALTLGSNNRTAIEAAANAAAARNGHNGDLGFSYWCVVAADEGGAVEARQIPSTCSPGKGTPYTAGKYPGLVCDDNLCFIPCFPELGGVCNTIRLESDRDVDYNFAPAIGYDKGNTGAVVSVACKGPCGTESPNPLDVVIMADRTASMNSENREKMKSAIANSLRTMNPEMHHVAFGALHKSRTTDFTHSSKFIRPQAPAVPSYENCQVTPTHGRWVTKRSGWYTYQEWEPNAAGRACETRNTTKRTQYEADKREYDRSDAEWAQLGKTAGWDGTGDTNGDGYCRTEAVRVGTSSGRTAAGTRTEGTWIPVPFNNTYLNEDGSLNNSSPLVDGVSCLFESASGEYGTHLAGAMKGAARYLMTGTRLPGASERPGEPRKVIIFETDGMPDEVGSAGGSTSLASDGDIFGGPQFNGNSPSGNGAKSCQNFLDVANNAKAQGILIVTIGFGDATSAGCQRTGERTSSGTPVRNVLAAAASPVDGSPSTASTCSNPSQIAQENSDGDYYFCAANGDELADIFRTALTQLSGGVKFLRMPR